MKRMIGLMLALILCASLAGCMSTGVGAPDSSASSASPAPPALPDGLEFNADGVPVLKVYALEGNTLKEMDIESYVECVLAGEMRNDWPEEALKAQAILARTFVLKFIETKDSKYEDADISTDVSEAQAFSAELVNDRIKTAVEQTRGMVMSYEGELTQAWFHAHAGGVTEMPSVGLGYSKDPPYLKSVPSDESERAPEEVKTWTARFSAEQVRNACEDTGVKVGNVTSVAVGRTGASGRAAELIVNGKRVSAPEFRLAIGANKLKSTLISQVQVSDDEITFTGGGFGHGVGMSQWGAYGMAEKGDGAEEIILHYYPGVVISRMWD